MLSVEKIRNDCGKNTTYLSRHKEQNKMIQNESNIQNKIIYSMDNFNVFKYITTVLPSVNRNDKFSNK